ncbi:MAG: cytochrome C [Campylobacterota bacterium]
MKKFLLMLVVASTVVMAKPYTIEDRIHDMNEMASAMNIIQSGFFYNNYSTVEAGVEKLSSAVSRVKPPLEEVQEQDVLARYMNQKIQMSNKIVKNISRRSIDILERMKDGDSTQAVQAYTKIMGQCMKCHREMRNW